jgi:hypothetical protein
LFADQDTFFSAWASVARALEEATEGGPASLEQATHSLPFEAPLLERSAEFMTLLRPSTHVLRTAAAPLGHAFKEGAINLAAATALNRELASSAQALQTFGSNPIVTAGLEDLTQTFLYGNPLLAGLAPLQAYCNYITLAFRNVASDQSQSIGSVGTVARAGVVLSPNGPNNEGFPSSAAANGPSVDHPFGSTAVIENNHVHATVYPSVGAPGQAKVCESGNERYLPGKATLGNLPASLVATNREFTSRNQNLYGEPYSTEQLRDLGLLKAKKPAAKKKGKKK